MNHDPIRRFTLLVLCQAQQDRATEMLIAPTDSERAAVRYKVDGTWHDMAPPPSHILPEVVAELGRLAKLPQGAFPKEGTIDIAYFTGRVRWRIQLTSAEAEWVLTPHAG